MHQLIQAALEAFPNFVIIDNSGRIVYLNDVYAKLLGTTKEIARGKLVDDVIPDTRLRTVLKTGKEEIGSIMTLYDHSKGHEISVVCNRIPIIENEKVIGALATTTINNLFEVDRLHKEIEVIKQENQMYQQKLNAIEKSMNPLERIVGQSKVIKNLKKTILDYADSNLSILITGETGVGKEVFAKAIHQVSNRVFNNYVKINCAAIPSTLLESELFGYADGAFTGAAKGGKIGKFELADKGTLLLDEIGEMPMNLQVKLLRVLQEKEFEKVGGIKEIPFTARLICCTNQNIDTMIAEGKFRQDLYYRINIVELTVPPLRDRLDDIKPLCQHFLSRINQENNLNIQGIDDKVIELFQSYDWPGNVRELEHIIERAAVICRKDIITIKELDFFIDKLNRKDIILGLDRNDREKHMEDYSLRKQIQDTEKELVLQALQQTGGNKTKAAKLLNIDRSRLYSRLKKYNIQ
ncbi:sigma 54-interacting transcriptional regulator [Tissierella sp.]|uniref:sigma-54 interaction domain-containing protein n=1 Tax=Tissierella sp. TaxID=41274 RepID=UPI00285B1145|nr:sigma 54-interacting transcriptional regulator [Tissierella sp.]MDR7855337.1 sigma 54-interacting transcriptional regulator [Tissierella sp.]